MADPADVRRWQGQSWTEVAGAWATRQDWLGNTRAVTDVMVEMLQLKPGEKVLDLACGAGEPALTLAPKVSPGGRVLGLDLSAAMVEATRARAKAVDGVDVEFRQISNETDLPVRPAEFDAATCRFGLMFMPDPVAAIKALHNALRPGGRIAVSTWGPPERNPIGAVRAEIVGRHANVPSLSELQPASAALDSIPKLQLALDRPGFNHVQVKAIPTIAASGDNPEDFWERQTRVSMALRQMLVPLSGEVRQAIRDDALETLKRMFPDGPVQFPGEALVASGRV